MADVLTEFIEPAELTGLVREALRDMEENRFKLAAELPNETLDGIDFTYLRGQGRLTEAGTFRAWDAESPLVRTEGLSREYGEVLPISAKATMGERERLKFRQLAKEQVVPFIIKDVRLLARTIGARLEMARANALWEGKVTINENKLNVEVDFNRSPDANLSLATTEFTSWEDHANSTPVDDLLELIERYEDLNGTTVGKIKSSKLAFRHALRSAQLQAYAFPLVSASERPRLTDDQALGVLSQFSDIPPIELYDVKVDVANSSGVRETRRTSPENRILMLPGSEDEGYDLGATYLGRTAEVDLPEYSALGDEGLGIVAGQWFSKDPVRQWIHAAAVVMPALRDANLSFAAEVF